MSWPKKRKNPEQSELTGIREKKKRTERDRKRLKKMAGGL
jgi:hypothetical protein